MYKIVYDAFQEARWFKSLSPEFKNAVEEKINSTKDPEALKLIKYDKPDIILIKDGRAVLALEKTTEVPTGHNVGQRFARIVASAEAGVPFIYFFPFVARKHGKFSSVCWINARLIQSMKNLSAIHKTPILAINWEVDKKHELVRDGSQDNLLKQIIADFIKKDFSPKAIETHRICALMDKEYQEAVKRHPQYSKFPPTVKIISTSSYIGGLKKKFKGFNPPPDILKRKESLIYAIGMKYVRSDPYTGMMLIYDYFIARKGVNPSNRKMNLILRMPNITEKLWVESSKNSKRKDIKLYNLFADLIELKNAIHIPKITN